MKLTFPTLLLGLLTTGLLGTGCDSKVAQCNRLIDTVNKHSPKLAEAVTKLSSAEQTGPAAEEMSAVIKAADEELAGLKFSDEKIAGFAQQYRDLLGKADQVGKTMASAADASDLDKANQAMKEAVEVEQLETNIVNEVNTYCQGG